MEPSKSSKEPVVLAPVDVDPRSYFSNERTCIEWLHSAGILGAFAAGLVNQGQPTPRIAGIFLLIPAVVVLIHAARMQQKRTRQLDARSVDSHFDRIGPSGVERVRESLGELVRARYGDGPFSVTNVATLGYGLA